MSLIELLVLLVIAGICGVIAEWVVGFSPGGFAVSIVVGLIGAYLGSYLASLIGLPPVLSTSSLVPQTTGQDIVALNLDFDIIYSIIGSILLLAILSVLRGTGRGGRRRRRVL